MHSFHSVSRVLRWSVRIYACCKECFSFPLTSRTSYKVIQHTKHDITCQTDCKSIIKDCFFVSDTCRWPFGKRNVDAASSECFYLWVNLHSRSNVLLKDWRTLVPWTHCFFHVPICISGALEMPFLITPECSFCRRHLSWDNMEVSSTERGQNQRSVGIKFTSSKGHLVSILSTNNH